MRIAVASEDFKSVTGHPGRSRNFLVFEAASGAPPRAVKRLRLRPGQTVREFIGDGPHPFDHVDAIIATAAGPGFVGRMAARGVRTVATSETDAAAAVARFLATASAAAAHVVPSHECAGDVVGVFKSLANETRLRVLFALADGEKCVTDVEHALGISQPRTSQELAYLRRAGLVEARRRGPVTYYRLKTPHVMFTLEAAYQTVCEKRRGNGTR